MSNNVELHLTVDRMLNGIPATCQHANFMCVISSFINYVIAVCHGQASFKGAFELCCSHLTSALLIFMSLACCTQGCGVTSRLVRLGAMGRDRPPWNGQQCRICWKLLNSASAESLETHQENSDRCLKWKNSTKPKDARPRGRRHTRATEQAARQSVNVKMQTRPARFHPRAAVSPPTPSRGTIAMKSGVKYKM